MHINSERNEQAVQLTPSTLEMTQQRPNALEAQRGDADEVDDDDDVTIILILDHFANDGFRVTLFRGTLKFFFWHG
jgi:hypothetical protein